VTLLPPSKCAILASTPYHHHPTNFLLSFFSFQRKYRRAGQDTLRTSVPQIDDELAESLRVLAELEARLPAIRTQASQVQLVYDSGRRKVRNYDNHFLPKRKKNQKRPLFLFAAHIGRSARARSPMVKSQLVRALVRSYLHIKGSRLLAVTRHDAYSLRDRLYGRCMDDFGRTARSDPRTPPTSRMG
jgi:hypothetical protein